MEEYLTSIHLCLFTDRDKMWPTISPSCCHVFSNLIDSILSNCEPKNKLTLLLGVLLWQWDQEQNTGMSVVNLRYKKTCVESISRLWQHLCPDYWGRYYLSFGAGQCEPWNHFFHLFIIYGHFPLTLAVFDFNIHIIFQPVATETVESRIIFIW